MPGLGVAVSVCAEVTMLTTDAEPVRAEDFVDDFLRLIAYCRQENPRDPLRRLEDMLLDLRCRTCA